MEAPDRLPLVADYFMKMYLEHRVNARHHETQRSTATTIFCSLAIFILSAAGMLIKEGVTVLPLTLGLIVIGAGGILLNMKLFERSALHLNVSDAYNQALQAVLADTVRVFFERPEQIKQLPYVDGALKQREGIQRWATNYRKAKRVRIVEQNKTGLQRSDTDDEKIIPVEDHNPVDPFEIVDPIHNQVTKFFGFRIARLDLYLTWLGIFAAFVALGLIGLLLIVFGVLH
jgi:hypothetical protein